jgi:hypothetical protein
MLGWANNGQLYFDMAWSRFSWCTVELISIDVVVRLSPQEMASDQKNGVAVSCLSVYASPNTRKWECDWVYATLVNVLWDRLFQL